MPRRHCGDGIDDRQIFRHVFGRIARIVAPPVMRGQIIETAYTPRQKPPAERAVRHEADAMLATGGKDVVLDIALPDRIFALQRGDRMDFRGAAHGLGGGFGEADVADLALLHQLGHAAHGLLDRHVGIDAVLIEQVDGVDAQPPQRALAGAAGVFRAAVGADGGVAVPLHRELGGDHQPLAPALDRRADQLLVAEGPVHLGGVEEGDAEVDRLVDRAGGGVVIGVAIVDVAIADHRHAADADRRDLQAIAQCTILHGFSPWG